MGLRKTMTGGPLRRRVSRVADVTDLEAVREVFAILKQRACSPEDRITRFACECREYLEKRGIDPNPSTVEGDVIEAGFGHPDPEWYCAQILNRVHVLAKVAARGDAWTAAGLAMDVGRMSVEMTLDGLDRQADGLERGRPAALGVRLKKAEAWRHPARVESGRIWAQNPNLSASRVALMLHQRGFAREVNIHTLRKAIAKFRPQKVGTDC